MEQISLGNRYKECRPRRTSSCQTKILVGKDVLNELEQRRSSPSVIAKLMGIDVLPPSNVINSRHQEFKDVFEVSEEPPEAVKNERSHHFPKGLPSLKRRAIKLKNLMPSKTLHGDDTHETHVDCTDGLGRLNSVEINNPLFEKCPHDMNYSANHQYRKDASSVYQTYPVGLANSSLSNFSLLSRGKNKDFNDIVVLEPPCLEKGHDPENIFSIPYLSPVNKNCRRGMKHKQSEFPVMENGRVRHHILGTEDNNVPRIRKGRFLTSDPINPLQIGHEASVHQFGNTDASCSGSSQGYSCGNNNFRKTNRSSSNSVLLKIRQLAESSVGSKTLAEMFALSDSERLKLNSDSHAPIRRNMVDHDNGKSKDECFIVLPKYAPLLSIRSSMDRNSCLEGSSQGKSNPDISNIYNNCKCQFDSFRDKPRLLKQIGNGSEVQLSNACCSQNLTGDNFSTPDCLNEKVFFTTDEDLVQQPTESEASTFNLLGFRKQLVTILPFHYHEDESISVSDHTDGTKSCKGSKEVEQPSPVSILEPPIDEDICFPGCFNYDMQGMTKKQRDGHQHHNESEVTMSSDDEDHSFYQSLEAFQVEENWDFSYLLDILICSGIIVADWQLICKSWYLPGCPVGPHVFDRLERKYNKITTWAKAERKLLFDLVNSILSEVLAPCVDVHPWVQPSRYCVALWGPEGPVEKVWQTIVRQREDSVTGPPDDMVLDANWLEVGNDINMVGKQIARSIHGDLLEEVIVDFLG